MKVYELFSEEDGTLIISLRDGYDLLKAGRNLRAVEVNPYLHQWEQFSGSPETLELLVECPVATIRGDLVRLPTKLSGKLAELPIYFKDQTDPTRSRSFADRHNKGDKYHNRPMFGMFVLSFPDLILILNLYHDRKGDIYFKLDREQLTDHQIRELEINPDAYYKMPEAYQNIVRPAFENRRIAGPETAAG
jgi:hypothetical protein